MNKKSVSQNRPKKSSLWTTLSLVVVVLLLIASYLFKGKLAPDVTAKLDTSCDLRKSLCSVALPGGGKVLLSLSPKTIPVMKPLELQVFTEGVATSSVDVVFVGIGMDMGYIRTKLQAIGSAELTETDTNNHFKGNIIIPICTQSRMEWEARVLLQTNRGQIVAPFRFYSQNNP